jgi:small subunit ribosomal protein S8
MTTQDPIADMLTRIRNATQASHNSVEMPSSKLKIEIAKILQREGFIRSYELKDVPDRNYQMLRLMLKYDKNGYPLIRHLRRVSRPGLRTYRGVDKIGRILGGAGMSIISTSKGLLTDREARRDNVGGEVLCSIY